jgi:Protein of unknown function (DUF1217)
MSFSPVVPFGGYTGWSFLQRTLSSQKTAFEADPALARDEAYFRDKIGSIKTAEALVADRRLLSVALGAYGLDGDINNKAFIRKVLDEGTLKEGTLANRLADKQYAALSAAFGFDLSVPRTQVSTFADKILAAYKARKFETAVGDQNNDMRLAMNARRELETLSKKSSGDTTKWLTILGNAPLRQVFEKAFGLPATFVTVDLDKQVATLRTRAEKALGKAEVAQFTDPKQVEKLLRQFLVRSDGGGTASSASSSALQILQSGGGGLSLRL